MRIHNTSNPIDRLVNVAQRSFERKPIGLWWARDEQWHNLLRSGTAPGLNGRRTGEIDYKVELLPAFNLLVLKDVEGLMEFSCKFGQPMPHAKDGFFWQRPGTRDHYDPDQDPMMPGRARALLIDWPAVARCWDGIEIPDLLEDQARPMIDWLDTDWGVGSGCAWRTDNLEVSLVEPAPEIGLGLL